MYSLVIIRKITSLLCICLFFASCQHPSLSVKMRSFDRNDLASCIVDTPDLEKEDPIFGQRLYIRWYIPQATFEKKPVTLKIRVRFENEKEIEEEIPTQSRWGSYMWMIRGKEYSESGGILAYNITLVAGDKIIAKSTHKFWVEKIQVKMDQ